MDAKRYIIEYELDGDRLPKVVHELSSPFSRYTHCGIKTADLLRGKILKDQPSGITQCDKCQLAQREKEEATSLGFKSIAAHETYKSVHAADLEKLARWQGDSQ